jgi:hypothetical protein
MNNNTRKLHKRTNFKHSLLKQHIKNTKRQRNYSSRHNKIKRSCDLSFYYTDDIASTPISKTHFGHSVIQTSIGPITDKSNTTKHYKIIGNCVQYKICMVTTNTDAFVSNIETFSLADGNIQIQPVGIEYKNTQGNYGLPPNATNKFKIINGTKKYLNSTGYVVLHTFPNLERLAKIYFTNKKNKMSILKHDYY